MARNKDLVEVGGRSWTRGDWSRMLTDADRAGDEYARRWPQVTAVRYDRAAKLIGLSLNNGAQLQIPAAKLQGVAQATEDQRADVSILGPKWAIQFPQIDQQFTVEELLCGVFGKHALDAAIRQQPHERHGDVECAGETRHARRPPTNGRAANQPYQSTKTVPANLLKEKKERKRKKFNILHLCC